MATKVYSEMIGRTSTPQNEPIPGRESEMVENEAGGFVFEANVWTRLRRFLILGSEGGTYYTSRRDLTRENLSALRTALGEDPARAADEIIDIAVERRAPSMSPVLFAAAVAVKEGPERAKGKIARNLDKIAQYPTHLFEFLEYVREYGGLGRRLRRAVSAWYNDRTIDQLAYWFIKYRQRNGWTHRDALLLAHVTPADYAHDALYGYVASRDNNSNTIEIPDHAQIQAYEAIRSWSSPDPEKVADLIRNYDLPREAIPSELRGSPEVWDALLDDMPDWALLRNLNTLTRKGVIEPFGGRTAEVAQRLQDLSYVHPIKVLSALVTYESGQGYRGSASWEPVPAIVDALNEGFYNAFDSIEPTGKSVLLGLDVSGSMSRTRVSGLDMLQGAQAMATMAMVRARSGDPYQVVKFNTDSEVVPISPQERLDDVVSRLRARGGTDVASPIRWAREKGAEPDAIVIYTDEQTWHGRSHVTEEIEALREESGKPVKLVTVNIASNDTTVADPDDPLALSIVGFDSRTPEIINGYLRDEF